MPDEAAQLYFWQPGDERPLHHVVGEEMPLCWRGWADDAGEEDADCPDYDSFMSVLEQE